MKEKAQPKVTVTFHPNAVRGEKYEVTKIVGTVRIEYDDPANTNQKLTVRVNDHISEAQALALADVAEVTTLQEK